jgi:hypothetical protein
MPPSRERLNANAVTRAAYRVQSTGESAQNVALMVERKREMGLVWIESGLAGRNCPREVTPMRRRHISIALALPQQDRNSDYFLDG